MKVIYWITATGNSLTLQASGGALHAQRGLYTDTTWAWPTYINWRPRVNLNGHGASVEWQFQINTSARWNLVYGIVHDFDAHRYVGFDCSVGGTSDPEQIACTTRFHNDQVDGSPGEYAGYGFDPGQRGVYYTFKIENPAERQIRFSLNGTPIYTKTLSEAEWGDFDWGTVRWIPFGWSAQGFANNGGYGNIISSDLDAIAMTNASEDVSDPGAFPSITMGGQAPNVWYTGNPAITYQVSDGGSGPRCIRAQWDSWPVNDGSCFVISGSTTHPGEGPRALYLRAWDWAGLPSTAVYTYYRDVTTPVATATSTLTTTDLNSWPITATVTESGGSGVNWVQLRYRKGATGTWQQVGGNDSSAPYRWDFTPASGEDDYQFCAFARDIAGNQEATCNTAELTITYDTIAPEISIDNIAVSPYAYLIGSSVYYNGNQTGAFTVTARVTDTDSGVKYMHFYTTTSPGVFSDTLTGGGLYGWRYTFSPTTTFSGTGVVTAGNQFNEYQQAQFNVIRDAVAPIVSVTAPTKTVSGLIPVQWSASDGLSGPTHVYTVSVITDMGPLQLWLNNTSLTSANFTPTFGHRYTFVVTATDNVRNTRQGTATTDAIQVTKYYYIGSSRVAMRRSAPTGTAVTYLHTDHLGTVSVATNQSQTVLARTLNMPYGSARWISGTMPTDYGFTGQKDTGLGLVYLHARYYASWVGRFVSADTVVPNFSNPQSLNRFSYVNNNPLKFIDPTGHDADCSAGDTACQRRVALEEEARAYGLSFTGEWDYNDMVETLNAVKAIANGLARTLQRRNRWEHGVDGIPIRFYSSTSSFSQTLGEVTFNRNPDNCGQCWARADNPWGTVQVYVQNVAHGSYTAQNAAHELGHTFDWRTGFQARADLQQKWNDDAAFPRRDPANVDLRGYAGTRFGWQQSHSTSASEEFADMFLGWAYSRWETDVNGALTPDGVARSNWMSANMTQWIALAIDQQ